MVSTFKNEKHCREETLGRACRIVKAARLDKRPLTAAEVGRVGGLIDLAETVLGISNIPRNTEALLQYAGRRSAARPNKTRNTK